MLARSARALDVPAVPGRSSRTFAEKSHTMTIHIKDLYQPQRELTASQANRELQAGTISTDAMAWKPGMEQWVPILSLPEIQAPIPPQATPRVPAVDRASNPGLPPRVEIPTSVPEAQTKPIIKILARVGIALAFAIVAVTCFSSSVARGGAQSAPLLGAFVGIALFRRLTRKRSEAMAIRHPSNRWILHYIRSYYSAGWRWLLFFSAIALLAALSLETAEEMGTAAGRAIGVMIFTMIFSADIPFRTFRRSRRESFSTFPERYSAWAIFGGVVIPLFGIALFAFLPPALTNALDRANRAKSIVEERNHREAAANDDSLQFTGTEIPYMLSTPAAWTSVKRDSPFDLTLLNKGMMILVMAEKHNTLTTEELTKRSLDELRDTDRLISSTDPEKVEIDGRSWNQMLVHFTVDGEEVVSIYQVYGGEEGAFEVVGIVKSPPFKERLIELIDVMGTFRFNTTK